MSGPSDAERVLLQGGLCGAAASAMAPLFGNNPELMGARGFLLGAITTVIGCGIANWLNRRHPSEAGG